MRQHSRGPEGQEAEHQVPQHRHHLAVLPRQQQAGQSRPQRHHQPAGADAGQQPDPGRPGLQIGGDRDQADHHHRHQQDGGHAPAITLQGKRLEVVSGHRADPRRDRQDNAQQRGNQQRHPGQLIAGLSTDGSSRADVGGVVIRRRRHQLPDIRRHRNRSSRVQHGTKRHGEHRSDIRAADS